MWRQALRGTAYAATGVAAMISPFIVGMIADRYGATQKVFGFRTSARWYLSLFGWAGERLGRILPSIPSFTPNLLHANASVIKFLVLPNMQDPQRYFPPVL